MTPELMTAQDVAPIIRMPKARVYRLIAQGVLPSIRIGQSIRIPRKAFESWLAKQEEQAITTVKETPHAEAA